MAIDLNEWFGFAQPGHTVEYYRGPTPQCRLDIFVTAWRLYHEGKVCLVQRCYGSGDYGYVAVKRRVIEPVPTEAVFSPHNRRNHIDVAA